MASMKWRAISAALTAAVSLLGADAKSIWSNQPASAGQIIREAFPVGNGRLGALPFGEPGQEKISLNVDTLWSGGPFETSAYNGGNPSVDKSKSLESIRNAIFRSGTGDVDQLLGSNNHYGSYRVLANLSIQIQGITRYTGYNRSLDLRTGIHTTSFLGNDRNTYTTATYCSYPAKVCVHRLSSSGRLPNVAIGVENRLIPVNVYSATCSANNVRFNGLTHMGTPRGMEYDLLVRLSTGALGMPTSSCATNRNGTIVVTGSAYGREQPLTTISVVIGAGTDYDQTQGTTTAGYSFHGPPPGPDLERVTAQASTKLESKLMAAHQQDYMKLMEAFSIELFDPWKNSQYPSEALPFTQLLDRYRFSAGISGNNKKRDLESDQDIRHKAAIANKGTSQRPAQFTPPTPPPPAYTSVVAGGDAFPDFHFPTKLPPGVTPTGAIAWSTNGLATVTGDAGKVYTVTLTATAAVAMGTARPVGQLPVNQKDQAPLKPKDTPMKPMKEPKRVAEDDLEQERLQDPTATQGDPYVEALLFDYARHLFISSSRDNSLPPNLAGVWEEKLQSAWSGDYHANINLQMNHWFADQVGLGSLQEALWKFMVNTWVPRGRETAKLLYNATGWVTHNEMNIFGHTGMKNTASWANYPASAAWMMQHVFDHWDYSRDLSFLQNSGYNLLREVSQFWMSQLVEDTYTKDGTLVVNPCNSPEHGPTTFGCTNYQQLIHQLLENTLAAADAVNDIDTDFTGQLSAALNKLDRGIHVASWGGLKEFKLPESLGNDVQGDKHRHLSHLVGWYPGYSIASFAGGYENATIQRAVAAALRSRGNGGADGNTGWAKVWRAACWARLNDTDQADYHLRYAIRQNFGANGLSVYDGAGGPFQIDANFGVAGAMLSMLIIDLPYPWPRRRKRHVVLGPAIPRRWGPGKISGLRVRGGTVLNMTWNSRGVVDRVTITHKGESCRFYSKEGKLIGEI